MSSIRLRNILIYERYRYGIRGFALDWFRIYVYLRIVKSILSKIEKSLNRGSEEETVTCAVPQG